MIEIKDDKGTNKISVLIVGVGGAGNNAVNRMAEGRLLGVDLLEINTDNLDLNSNKADVLQIGKETTKGLGAGGKPEVGREAANESASEICELLSGYNMVIITCGLGGGTGTGASPVIAKMAKDLDILTVAVVTTPFFI